MGVKTNITIDQLKNYIDATTLTPSYHGVHNTVYFVDNNFVLKLFEESSIDNIQAEISLLKACSSLPVAQIVKEPFTIDGKPALLYAKCKGKSITTPSASEINQIGAFLKAFHRQTQGQGSTNTPLYERQRLEKLIDQTQHSPFMDVFKQLDIPLKNDGIIHGDLFIDNASFHDGKISCVYDFGEACNGDFRFDLAVAALSWCRRDEDIAYLLEGYEADFTPNEFAHYVAYAALYYSVTRFLSGRNFDDLWEKIQ